MKRISAVKMERSAGGVIAFGCVCTIAVQIAGALITALLVGKGSIAENQMNITATGVRLMSIIVGTVIAWFLAKENKLVHTAVVTGIVLAVSFIAALLFWELDGAALAVGAVVSLTAWCSAILLLSRLKGRGKWTNHKKRYR